LLDGAEVIGITPELRGGQHSRLGVALTANSGKQFYGVVPTGSGFILRESEAHGLLAQREADYSQVVRPYLVGDDITASPRLAPSRWVISFDEMPLEKAMVWSGALDLVRERVKPQRDIHPKERERKQWWKFSRTVQDMFEAIRPLSRFIACPAQSKRFYMIWCEPEWCPSNLTSVFAFDDDFAMGVLTSAIHTRWAREQSTTLETRPRYTTASFMSFPWPSGARDEIADAASRLVVRRGEICLERGIGLTKLYNQMDEGAWQDLRALHRELDEAVALGYGWPSSSAHDPDDSNRRLLELNRAIAAGEVRYNPFR
jgi:hypothetical protein